MADTVLHLGEQINTVNQPTYACPNCGHREPYTVHRHGVRWACGHTRSLPRMSTQNRGAR